jgi:sugar/nucleoside kinase (ribokinase family)
MCCKSFLFAAILAVGSLHATCSYEVLGIGAPVADMILPVSHEFMANIPGQRGGSQEVDLGTLKGILMKSPAEPKYVPGGSAANTLKGLASLGTKAAFLGKVGQDEVGKRLETNLLNAGVISLLLPANTGTGQLVSLITPDGERTFRIYAGSTLELGPNDLKKEYFEGVRLVHIEGYALRNFGLVQRSVELAKQAGAKISFDLGCHELANVHREYIMQQISNHIDIIFGNEEEIGVLTGLDPEEACEYLTQYCDIVVVLRGKKGCLIGHKDELIACQPFPAEVKDTTGAGDLFASGFLHGYLRGYSLENCGDLGNLLGSTVVQVYGAEIPNERWFQVKNWVNSKFELIKNEKVH